MDSKILHQADVEQVIETRVTEMQIGSALRVQLSNGAVEVPITPAPKLEVELYPIIVAGEGWDVEDNPTYTNGIPISSPGVFLATVTGTAVYSNDNTFGGVMTLYLTTDEVGDQIVRTIAETSELANQLSPISASGVVYLGETDDVIHVQASTSMADGETWTLQSLRIDLVKLSPFGFAWL